ncbi:hypothetical protein SAMN04490243_0447 [Robiginitalea myxolifaciens]|uniref:Outer membrane protein beta-barrel domain-containing protein n=1 Tax=Robiginitalea myxolifaciens TaxID=400055 RepID=A0A1I6FR16_9FLAO|nr:hypothetical protein [Robiginitalea myxolifaciens]SFR32217.1 hypothetical protein SAMN04490243_0447 [Robiginitalea myxolifaciens]
MKRLIFGVFALFFTGGILAQQGVKLGGNVSLPITEELNDRVGLGVGLDLGYMHALGERVDLGVMTGFIHGFAEKYEVGGADLPSVQFIPVAASVRLWLSNSFSLGGDGGYALGLADEHEGGVYLKPIVGVLLGAQTEINLSYTQVTGDIFDWSTVNFGILYTFPQKYRTRY